jgi:hypothetical protein
VGHLPHPSFRIGKEADSIRCGAFRLPCQAPPCPRRPSIRQLSNADAIVQFVNQVAVFKNISSPQKKIQNKPVLVALNLIRAQ